MLAASLFIAIGRIMDGFVVKNVNPMFYSFFTMLGMALFLLLALILRKKVHLAKKLLVERSKLAIISGAVNAYSYMCLLFAFTAIEISIAEPASILGTVITLFLAEREFKENLKERLLGVAIMFAATWLLFFH